MVLFQNAFFLLLLVKLSNCFIIPSNIRCRSSPWTLNLKVGFVGFGTIASSIAQGLLDERSKVTIESLIVSERSVSKSTALKEKFPDLVKVYKDTNMIVKESDVIFLCVLPQQAQKVLQGLNFDTSKHKVISLVSTATLKELARDSKLPSSNVARLICLPAIAKHSGVALYCSSQPPTDNTLDLIPGNVLYCKTEDQLSASMITTCTMGPFYGLLRQQRDWLIYRGGLSQKDASDLVIQQHIAMLQDALKTGGDEKILDELIEEQTPGGLNEQALANWQQLGGLDSYNQILDAILARLKGESDGSI